ncbi:GNAT family N-acetyltransferase [Streptococcus macacae]|uniref:Acetyltransferase, GNAT family n=1 Tax=Streptococcus macacae NCTC 11558 TaxID=764298 RepID=G5JZ44_9STRE|nr:N-acetyltransferase [Streptococcus macacae]EHJ52760.1 acetyltransferase, GNAT family [Streptococcus macacae NCTC 11558]SUN78297.1 putative acetyltransferase [Streptococcus macacae NCTC 11558]
MTVEIRQELPSEYREVENLVREAFWNVYQPGCSEHLILHQFRHHPNYLKDLSKIILVDGQIAGQITYSKALLRHETTNETKEIALFGPFAISPDFQKRGLGKQLLQTTLDEAKAAGISYVIILGDPDYYKKFAFLPASTYGVALEGQDKSEPFDFLQILDLQADGSISQATGPWIFADPEGYEVDEKTLEAFDSQFPAKEKKVLPGQL